jgi:hypothetical protein
MTHSFDQQAHAEPAAIATPHQQRLPSGLQEELASPFALISTTSALRRRPPHPR